MTVANQTTMTSQKLAGLRPYVFAELDERVYELREQGIKDIVDLGKADPDKPTPDRIVTRLQETAADPENHHYPAFRGSLAFRESVSRWYARRFGVEVNPETEVIGLLGSKEGLFHISLAYLQAGDVGLVPDPAFPTYNDGVWFAGATPKYMPLRKENGWLPDLQAIDVDTLQKAKIMFLNYPNNPTGVIAPMHFLKEAVHFAKEHNILLCYDHAYSEFTFEGRESHSILEFDHDKSTSLEFMTFSKTFDMAGWRLGAAVGSKEAIQSLLVVQSHINSGIFSPIQFAGITALDEVWPSQFMTDARAEYQRRRDYAVQALQRIGWDVEFPEATVYLWVRTPPNMTGEQVAEELLQKYHVVVAPGTAFGETGHHYIRLSLTTAYENVVKGMDRIANYLSQART